MSNLYETLGVSKQATQQQIKQAYRRKAKKAHPDHGGAPETWRALQKAHDILSDNVRRARYDATGDESEKAPDNALAEVLGILTTAFDAVCGAAIERGFDLCGVDLVADMKTLLKNQIGEIDKRRSDINKAIKRMEKAKGRFSVKDGENYLEKIIASKMQLAGNQLEALAQQQKPIDGALNLLKQASFAIDESATPQHSTPSFIPLNIRFF